MAISHSGHCVQLAWCPTYIACSLDLVYGLTSLLICYRLRNALGPKIFCLYCSDIEQFVCNNRLRLIFIDNSLNQTTL